MERIISRQNQLCAHLRRLAASKAYREEQGEFLCDSPKLLQEALLWNAEIRTVVYTPGAVLPRFERPVRLVEVSGELMRYLSPMETPQGVLFTCAMPETSLPERLDGRHYLVLEGVQDPGNVGTILRTADAFDCDGLFLLPGCADPFSPKTLRSAMGVLFRRSVWRCDKEQLYTLLKNSGVRLCGAALRQDAKDVRRLNFDKLALAIGSEGRGLSEDFLSRCDETVIIPMSERCESLNAAAAAAVLLWEMFREV